MTRTITLSDIAGYVTERTVWQMMLDLSRVCDYAKLNNIVSQAVIITDSNFQLQNTEVSDNTRCRAFLAPESFSNGTNKSKASGIWTLGALAFYAITGMYVFEGKGGETQTKDTEIPCLSSAHASRELSELIRRCLSYSPQERPTKEEIEQKAQSALAQTVQPRKRLSSQSGKSYGSSLIKFWPEEMVTAIFVFIFLLFGTGVFAQSTQGFDKTAIPNEMANLVMRCIDLRSSQNVGKVSKAMDRDMNWTMMDELPLDKNGECTIKDVVDVFGLNDMGFSILKRHGGVTNAGGRFRDGRDPRYKYSFIEITVKQGKTVNYSISGREGEQIFAIVPYEKDVKFKASIPHGELFEDNGICYIRLKQGIKKNDVFKLTIKNESGKNMAFALVNYNSRNNE